MLRVPVFVDEGKMVAFTSTKCRICGKGNKKKVRMECASFGGIILKKRKLKLGRTQCQHKDIVHSQLCQNYTHSMGYAKFGNHVKKKRGNGSQRHPHGEPKNWDSMTQWDPSQRLNQLDPHTLHFVHMTSSRSYGIIL